MRACAILDGSLWPCGPARSDVAADMDRCRSLRLHRCSKVLAFVASSMFVFLSGYVIISAEWLALVSRHSLTSSLCSCISFLNIPSLAGTRMFVTTGCDFIRQNTLRWSFPNQFAYEHCTGIMQ